ncbi:MAG: carbohydrate ABC transporter permease [Spirochaetaceae bacterium]|nr:carbohydrate ABC transporter permease [Spirochaetaceae bacterium]
MAVTSSSRTDKAADAVIMVLVGCLGLVCLIPILNSLALSLSDKAIVEAGAVFLVPRKINLTSYGIILEDRQFFRSFLISIERVVLGGIINFVITLLMAYPLSKERSVFRAREVYIYLLLVTMLFSGGLIPIYMIVNAVGIMDTIWALVLPGAVPVFNVIIMMNFFRQVPRELEEAATVDGARQATILAKIYLPLSVPSVATVTLFSMVAHWNAFFDGLIYMNSPRDYPLQTYIQTLVLGQHDFTRLTVEEIKRMSQTSSKTLNNAKIIVSMIPMMMVYPFLQRYFVKGLVLGSVKG